MFQLLPANKAGRSFLFDLSDDDYADSCCKTQVRQIEEDCKWVDANHSWINVPCKDVAVSPCHFSESIPVPRAETIHTPPPDLVS